MNKIVFFNNKRGVGKTTTIYHLTWMFAELGYKVLVADLDPQSTLSTMFLTTNTWITTFEENAQLTILDAIAPIDVGATYQGVHVEKITENIGLVIGNLSLSLYEEVFSEAWSKCLDGDRYSFEKLSAFKITLADAAQQMDADIVLIDIGSNLGAINRTVLLSSDTIIFPLSTDLLSHQELKTLGATLINWRSEWERRKAIYQEQNLESIPCGRMEPMGYVVMQYSAREKRPIRSYMNSMPSIPDIYAKFVLQDTSNVRTIREDKNCLGILKYYHSLALMSMGSNKPMFLLKPRDGAVGAHVQAVKKSYLDFEKLVQKIAENIVITVKL